MPRRFSIYSAKTAAILVLGSAGLAFTPHAQTCGEPHGQLGVAALVLLVPLLEAQSSASLSTAQLTSSSVARAYQLWSRGQPKAAIAILEPLLRAGSRFDDARNAGVAWNILGNSYLDLDRYAEAKQGYQHAIDILRPIASARAQYGTALDSMGMFEVLWGNGMRRRRCARKRDRSMRSWRFRPGGKHIHQSRGDCPGPERLQSGATISADGNPGAT